MGCQDPDCSLIRTLGWLAIDGPAPDTSEPYRGYLREQLRLETAGTATLPAGASEAGRRCLAEIQAAERAIKRADAPTDTGPEMRSAEKALARARSLRVPKREIKALERRVQLLRRRTESFARLNSLAAAGSTYLYPVSISSSDKPGPNRAAARMGWLTVVGTQIDVDHILEYHRNGQSTYVGFHHAAEFPHNVRRVGMEFVDTKTGSKSVDLEITDADGSVLRKPLHTMFDSNLTQKEVLEEIRGCIHKPLAHDCRSWLDTAFRHAESPLRDTLMLTVASKRHFLTLTYLKS